MTKYHLHNRPNRELKQEPDINAILKNGKLKHQLEELKRMIYGSKRERFIAPDPLQSTLFDLPKGNAGASMMAHILVSKFVDPK
jgi:hypothetical protein